MTRIHILSPGFSTPNGAAFLFPILKFRHALRDLGLHVQIFSEQSEALTNCDILLIEHKAITNDWHDQKSLETVAKFSDKTNVIWCDQSDSSGTFVGQILPYVAKYLKAQTLEDVSLYMQPFYGDRIYTEYYHQKYGITDDISYDYQPVKTKSDLEKIGISWNSGTMNHGYYGPYLNRLMHRVFIPPFLRFANRTGQVSSPRNLDVSCRMGISYPRETICFQRGKMREALKKHLLTEKLSRQYYLKELNNAKITASPFGYGEITLKDFEVFLAGSCLLKPDMSHMKTWPNFYENETTYMAHDWDLNNIHERIETLLENPKKRLEIAQNGQNRYLKFTKGPEASSLFAQHFKECIAL